MPRKRLSSSEWSVMTALWRAGRGSTVQDVRDALPADDRRDYRTIQTLLHRMAEKGWVRCDRPGTRVYYAPAVRQRTGISERTRDFLAEIALGGEKALEVTREVVASHKIGKSK